MEKLTEDTDKSIADGLSLDKLELYVNKVTKNSSVPTNTSRPASGQPTGDFGGYDSIQEYAMKDPKGAEKYLEQNVTGYIK